MIPLIRSHGEIRDPRYMVRQVIIGCHSDRGPLELAELGRLVSVRQNFELGIAGAFGERGRFSIVLNRDEWHIVWVQASGGDEAALGALSE